MNTDLQRVHKLSFESIWPNCGLKVVDPTGI